MRKIKYFEDEYTVEEYVKKEICKNGGTQSIALKGELAGLADERGLEYDKKTTKDELFDLLIADGCGYDELAKQFGVGVSSQMYQNAFGISHQDVKRLEKHGVLIKVGEYRFRAFGDYKYAPLYCVYQFARMTDEDMQKYLTDYPKGKRVSR